MPDQESREKRYRIEDEDLDDDAHGDSDNNNKLKIADLDEVVNPSDKKEVDSDKYDDIISRMYKSNQAKLSQQTSKIQ